MRIGIVALLHESNTFVRQRTTLDRFREDLLIEGEAIRDALAASHHEIGGFFSGLDALSAATGATAVPLFAARAMPSGTISADAFDYLLDRILNIVSSTAGLDGILVAPHGAAVSEKFPDADGVWLDQLRNAVDATLPIIGTLDAHANLSRLMVDSCNALVAYRTNPHLDQRERGREAARLMVATLRGDVRPTMAAAFPPLAINIERQCTSEPHLQPLYRLADAQLDNRAVISNSILLGFPYADVPEMGAATIAVTNDDAPLAACLADELASWMSLHRQSLRGELISVKQALNMCADNPEQHICLLDMGDNVGGGSAADGTSLAAELLRRRLGPSFVCLFDPEAVKNCQQAGVGARLRLCVGGKSDAQHGAPLEIDVTVETLHAGRFREDAPRHGGIVKFDQGPTAVVRTADNTLTVMLTTLRMVPFSLQQIISCDLDPKHFRVLVAKGVNAPIAAYREVCDRLIRVNTLGSTCADLEQLVFHHRRHPLFPFEELSDV